MKLKKLLFLPLMIIPVLSHAQVDYESEIQPIFSNNCTSCHGGESGVTLSSYNAVMNSEGDQYGEDIVNPGNASDSPLVDKISSNNPEHGERMPVDADPLSSEEINLIRDWIDEGATETPVSIEQITDLPDGYLLKGSYPNPFNPSTTVLFEVPEAVAYNISVYSVHGALVKEIAGRSSAGNVSVTLNFGEEPSGIYIYKVVASVNENNYLLGSGRMTLIK